MSLINKCKYYYNNQHIFMTCINELFEVQSAKKSQKHATLPVRFGKQTLKIDWFHY